MRVVPRVSNMVEGESDFTTEVSDQQLKLTEVQEVEDSNEEQDHLISSYSGAQGLNMIENKNVQF